MPKIAYNLGPWLREALRGEGGGNHPAEIMCEDVTAIEGAGVLMIWRLTWKRSVGLQVRDSTGKIIS